MSRLKLPRRRSSVRTHARPGVPSVNLLSPWSFEQMATRALRRRFVLGALALVMLMGAGWAGQHLRVSQAQQQLEVAQAETSRLTGKTQELVSVRTFVAGVEQQKMTVKETMAGEVYFSEVLDGLAQSTPSAAILTSVAVTLAPPAAATPEGAAAVSPCPGPDPFNTLEVVGCVTLSGTAPDRADVGDFVIALGESRLFVEPFISTTTTGDATDVSFSGSVGLSPKVYSRRYKRMEKLLAGGDVR
ncbi:PilN domain-containing protein [Nocardioides pacificus]